MPVQDPGFLSPTALLLIGFGVLILGVIVALVLVARRRPQQMSSLEERLEEYSAREEPITLEELELSVSFAERIIYPAFDAVGRFLGQFAPAQSQERTRHRLELAGNPGIFIDCSSGDIDYYRNFPFSPYRCLFSYQFIHPVILKPDGIQDSVFSFYYAGLRISVPGFHSCALADNRSQPPDIHLFCHLNPVSTCP